MVSLFKKYPIDVLILTRYENSIGFKVDTGRYEQRKQKTMDGFIQTSYLMLKKAKFNIPAPEISFYTEIGRKRKLMLYQVDRETYWPISNKGEELIVSYPAIKVDKKGKPVLDKDGKHITIMEQRPLFSSTIAFEDGRTIKIPSMITHKTYDKEHFLSDEIETAMRLYRKTGFWDKYGNVVILATTGVVIAIIMAVSLGEYRKITEVLVMGMIELGKTLGGQIPAPQF